MANTLLSSLADYHMHTPLCLHAEGWPVDYARAAVERGLGEIGFADHNPMPEKFDDWRMLREDLPRYFDEVARARAEFPQLNIKLGLECDYIPGHEWWIEELAGMADWDYLIGSVHYLPDGWDVDNPKNIGRHMGGAASAVWHSYWSIYEQCIRSGLFDFVAHPDLPKKFGIRPEGDLLRFYGRSIEALAETGMAYEINTAGMRNQCAEPYPDRRFVELARAAGVPVLINSDAHRPGDVAFGFEQAAELAKSCGYTHTLRFTRRQRSSVPIAGA